MLAPNGTIEHLLREEDLNLLSSWGVDWHVWLAQREVLAFNKERTVVWYSQVIFFQHWVSYHC